MRVLSIDPGNTKTTTKHKYYFKQCDCGVILSLRIDNNKEFCNQVGCQFSKKIKHGCSGTRLYNIWDGIKSRVDGYHKSSKTYKDNGILLCDEWRSFSTFKIWAESNGYSDDLTIDRLNIDGNYEPSNCEWVTRQENSRRQIRDGHGPFKTRRKGSLV